MSTTSKAAPPIPKAQPPPSRTRRAPQEFDIRSFASEMTWEEEEQEYLWEDEEAPH